MKPYVNIMKVRKAGKVYEVPVPFKKKKQLFIILKWLLNTLKKNNKRGFLNAFVSEIINLFLKRGSSFKYKTDLIKKVYANRAITHFRWT